MSKELDTCMAIISDMTKIMDGMKQICAQQAASLKECQADLREMIRTNISQQKILEQCRSDYHDMIMGYREELRSAKELYNSLRNERPHNASNRSDININYK